ncbi:MAG: acetate kinase [Pseudomonadota bacterium]
MTVLVINCGSSSVKFQLVDADPGHATGAGASALKGQIEQIGTRVPDHAAALDQIAQTVKAHLARTNGQLSAIGHRVVHGGTQYRDPAIINAQVIDAIDRLAVLAPLHNPANNDGIKAALRSFPGVPQVAVFDTAFHATIPEAHRRYAVPEKWEREYQVRRYGFHGTSHQFVSRRCAQWLEANRAIDPTVSRIVVLHLGNGASACAVLGGASIDTSMGLTPLPGLVMGTRSGDIDPAVFGHLNRVAGMSVEAVETALNRESGMVGMCADADMRAVESRIQAGDAQAEAAMAVYIHRIRSVIGAYAIGLGGIDAVAFTAGIGENSAYVRARVTHGLEWMGMAIDDQRNAEATLGPLGVSEISTDASAAALLVIPTNEELEIATQALSTLS